MCGGLSVDRFPTEVGFVALRALRQTPNCRPDILYHTEDHPHGLSSEVLAAIFMCQLWTASENRARINAWLVLAMRTDETLIEGTGRGLQAST